MNILELLGIENPKFMAIIFSENIKNMIETVYQGKTHVVSPTEGNGGWFICADVLTETNGIYGHDIESILTQNLDLLSVVPISEAVNEEGQP